MDVAMYNRALDSTNTVLNGLTPQQLTAQTPCTEWTVRDVLHHLVETSSAAIASVKGDSALEGQTDFDEDPVAAFQFTAKEVGEVLSAPGALEKTYDMPWGETPGEMLLGLAIADTTIHGWDIAAGTGQPFDVDDDVAEAVLGMTTSMLEPKGQMPRGPSFAPPVEVPADAPVMDQVVGYMGRDPKAAAR